MISIIIPTFNHENTIERCLESLFNQTCRDLEIIVVNDGSTDNTAKTLDRYRGKITIIDQPNQGANAARNAGFAVSQGDYVLFADDDAIFKPSAIQTLLQALENNPQASYAYCRFRFGWKLFKLRPFDAERLKQINYIHTSSLIRRKDFVGFDESVRRFQDWDLWLTLLESGKTGVFVKKNLFRILTGNPVTISKWLPSFVYRLPFKPAAVKKYEAARYIILTKHGLINRDR